MNVTSVTKVRWKEKRIGEVAVILSRWKTVVCCYGEGEKSPALDVFGWSRKWQARVIWV